MSEGEGHGNIGKESLSTEIKAMMSNMFTEFKTDIMQSVTDTMETRFNELYEEYDYSDVEESHNNLDVSALMQTITDSNKGESSTPQVTKTGNQPTEFDTILTELNPEKAHGPPICEKVAVLVNSLLKEGLSKDQLAMKKEYLKPENCPMLEAPKVNTMLWGQLKQEPKNLDLSLQKGQGHLMSSLYALLKVCNQLIDKADSKEMLTMLTHAVVLSLSANRQLNLSRRELVRPHLNKNYQALCNPAVPITTNLFGDDLNKQVDDLTKANKIGLKVQGSGKQRFHPYGRGSRARGRYRQNYGGRGRSSTATEGRGSFLGSGRGGYSRRPAR